MSSTRVRKRKIGFSFEYARRCTILMSVEENVAFPLKHNTKMPESEQHDRVMELLTSVGMENDLKKMPSDISGGMQKQMSVWRARWRSIRTFLLLEVSQPQGSIRLHPVRSISSFFEVAGGGTHTRHRSW